MLATMCCFRPFGAGAVQSKDHQRYGVRLRSLPSGSWLPKNNGNKGSQNLLCANKMSRSGNEICVPLDTVAEAEQGLLNNCHVTRTIDESAV